MTLVKRGKVYHFDFVYNGVRHQGTTEQRNRHDAELVEDQRKTQLRREKHGLIAAHPEASPFIQEFALVYYASQSRRLTRPDVLERTLRMVLGFWGKKPKTKKKLIADAPYHHLRLSAPITDPRWLDRFERWMDDRKLSGSSKNSYLSAMSGLYKLAANARYRSRTGVDRNPFADVGRHPTRKRRVTATRDDVLKWMQHGAPHFVLALTIGALAHKLRVSQVLQLRFDQHIDREMTKITFESHKTVRHSRQAQVTVISKELRRVLLAIKTAKPKATYVITWRGEPVKSLKTAARQAAERAKLPYGLQDGAVTFHALRHISTTELVRMGISAALTGKVAGHLDPRTTAEHYVSLIESDEQRAVDDLGTRLGLADEAIKAVETSVGTHQNRSRSVRGNQRGSKSTHRRGKKPLIH